MLDIPARRVIGREVWTTIPQEGGSRWEVYLNDALAGFVQMHVCSLRGNRDGLLVFDGQNDPLGWATADHDGCAVNFHEALDILRIAFNGFV